MSQTQNSTPDHTEDSISHVALGPDAQVVAVAHGAGFVTVTQRPSAPERCTIRLSDQSIWQLAVDRTGAAVAGYRGDLGLRDTDIHVAWCSGSPAANPPITLRLEGERPTALAMAEDGAILFSGHEDGRVFAWPLREPAPQPVQIAQTRSSITAVEYRADQLRLIVGDINGQLVSVQGFGPELQFAPVVQLGVQSGYITRLALSPDGALLAALDIKNRLALWHVPTNRLIHRFKAELHHQAHIGFSRSGGELRAAPAGPMLRWTLDEADWRKTACGIARRLLSEAEALRYPGLQERVSPCG